MKETIRWLFVEDWAGPGADYEDYPKRVDAADRHHRLRHLDPPANTVPEALTRTEADLPDVVLLDLALPVELNGLDDRENGIVLAEQIHARQATVRMLVLSSSAPKPRDRVDRDRVLRLHRAGVTGYLRKGTPYPDVAEAIKITSDGRPAFSSGTLYDAWNACLNVPHPCFSQPDPMTPKEHEVMIEAATTGDLERVIAERLSIRPGTVGIHLSRAAAKMGVDTTDDRQYRNKLNHWATTHCPVVMERLFGPDSNS